MEKSQKSWKKQKNIKNKKQKCIGEPSPLPPSQSRLPKLVFWYVFFCFLFLVPLSFQNTTQNKSSKTFICLFVLVWGRGGDLISSKNIWYAMLYLWHLVLTTANIDISEIVDAGGVFVSGCRADWPAHSLKSILLLLQSTPWRGLLPSVVRIIITFTSMPYIQQKAKLFSLQQAMHKK